MWKKKTDGKKTVRVPEFGRLHPAVNFIYLTGCVLVSMLTLNPWILGVSFFMSLILAAVYQGRGGILQNLVIEIPVFIFTVLIQPLFSHSGSTPLFYINDNAVTSEAYLYGFMIAVLLVSVIQWCACARSLLTADKWMYLFGRIIPTLGLIFSMILRFVPLMRARYRQIHEGQQGLGRTAETMKLPARIRLYVKEISILISWSLEASIDTAASMEARGYGLKGRTSYHLYHWKGSDAALAGVLMSLLGLVLAGIFSGGLSVYYLPRLCFAGNVQAAAGCTAAFIVYAAFPLLYEAKGAIRWRCLNSKI